MEKSLIRTDEPQHQVESINWSPPKVHTIVWPPKIDMYDMDVELWPTAAYFRRNEETKPSEIDDEEKLKSVVYKHYTMTELLDMDMVLKKK